jgi:hypothetical protein
MSDRQAMDDQGSYPAKEFELHDIRSGELAGVGQRVSERWEKLCSISESCHLPDKSYHSRSHLLDIT